MGILCSTKQTDKSENEIIPEEYKTKEIDNNEVKKDQATIKKSLRKSSKSSLEN